MPTIIGIEAARGCEEKDDVTRSSQLGTFEDPLPTTRESGSGFFVGQKGVHVGPMLVGKNA